MHPGDTESKHVLGDDTGFEYVSLAATPPADEGIEITAIQLGNTSHSSPLIQNQLQSSQAAARLHNEIHGSGYKALARKRWHEFWYAESGCQFVLAEALKITMSVISYYGVVSYAMWDNCDMPATSQQAVCNFDYDNLRLYEVAALAVLFISTGLFRRQRRKIELTPALNVHRQFANRWVDMSHHRECDLSHNIEELFQLHSVTPLQQKLSNLSIALDTVGPTLNRLQKGVLSYQKISLRKSWCSTLDKAVRIGVSGFLGFNLGMQFLLMLSTLSKRDDFEWHGSDLSKLGFVGWCTVLFSVAAVFKVIPDDLSAQTEDINHKTVRQYELIANSCLDKKNTLSKQLSQCSKALSAVENDLLAHGGSATYETQMLLLKDRIAQLNSQASTIAIPQVLLADDSHIVKIGAVRRLTPGSILSR
ncbi:MAG: hypothetical protein P1U40_10495 [Coxiellaceae bacterium]|nr:hypothetical protein [Coxiellaceae bacterium]